MKKIYLIIPKIVLLLLLSKVLLCASADVKDLRFSLTIDKETSKPINIVKQIKQDARELSISGYFSDVPKDTSVYFLWYLYQSNGKPYIVETVVTVPSDGNGYISSTFKLDEGSIFPLGKHHVDIVINNRVISQSHFDVISTEDPKRKEQDSPKPTSPINKTQFNKSTLQISKPTISLNIEKNLGVPIDIQESIAQDNFIIYASADIYNLPKDDTIDIKWYYYKHKKPILFYKKSLKIGDKKFIYNQLGIEGRKLPLGIYKVTFESTPQNMRSSFFRVIETNTSINNTTHCNISDPKSIEHILQKVQKKYPDISNQTANTVYVHSDSNENITFLAPKGWHPIKSKGSILFLSPTSVGLDKYMITKVDKFWDPQDAKDHQKLLYEITMTMQKIAIENALKDNDKIEGEEQMSLFEYRGFTISHTLMQRTGSLNQWRSYTFLWAEDEIYSLVIITNGNDPMLGEYLSSLWIESFCKVSQRK